MSSERISQPQIDRLVDTALSARQNAYAPYSKFQVGAAVLSHNESGAAHVYAGCNVENASYGLCICAERTAICAAIANSARTIIAVAVVASPLALPCGACRQFIHEFGRDVLVICVDAENPLDRTVRTIESLIPDCFTLESSDE